MAHQMLQWTYLWSADYDEAMAHADAALRAFAEDFDPLHATWARSASTWTSAQWGAWTTAIAEGETSLRLGEEHANNSLIAFSAMVLCITYTGQGQLNQALAYGDLALQKAPTPGEALWATIALGHAWARTGRAEQAAETLAAIAPVCEAAQVVFVWLWTLTILGEAYWRAGRPDEARQTLELAVEEADRRQFRFLLGSALRLLGEVTRRDGHLKRSIDLLSEIGAENELALALAGQGRLCHDRGEVEEARRFLTQAMGIFERLGTVVDAELALIAEA
jgi:tetratricopeptide (TPR) repeat protein